MPFFARLAKVFFLICAVPAQAHEFWLEPHDYSVAVGEEISADLKNGENFKGATYSYIPEQFSSFNVHTRKGTAPVPGRRGDYPALTMKATTGGLHVFAFASARNVIVYPNFEKFKKFATGVGLDWVIEQHIEREMPQERVREHYYRYAKALVKVGSGAGNDKFTGMPFELVAEINPYSSAAKKGVRLRLYQDGVPAPNFELQVFNFPPGQSKAVKTILHTDATGRALVPRGDGGEFMVNAVQILVPGTEDAAGGAQWTSIWATSNYSLEE
ncbi:MAG: DUF4198 domain-containing protein [Pikeienuella sp.]